MYKIRSQFMVSSAHAHKSICTGQGHSSQKSDHAYILFMQVRADKIVWKILLTKYFQQITGKKCDTLWTYPSCPSVEKQIYCAFTAHQKIWHGLPSALMSGFILNHLRAAFPWHFVHGTPNSFITQGIGVNSSTNKLAPEETPSPLLCLQLWFSEGKISVLG